MYFGFYLSPVVALSVLPPLSLSLLFHWTRSIVAFALLDPAPFFFPYQLFARW